MQAATPDTSPHSWATLLYMLLSAALGGGAAWFTAYRNRKKPEAEIDLSDAQATRERAEARKIDAEVTKTYNDIIRDINRDLRDAESRQHELESEIEAWKRKAESVPDLLGQIEHLQNERDALEKQLGLKPRGNGKG